MDDCEVKTMDTPDKKQPLPVVAFQDDYKNKLKRLCPLYVEEEDGKNKLKIKDSNDPRNMKQMIVDTTGIANEELALGIITGGAASITWGSIVDRQNFILQILAEQQPQDIHEARLCAQAAVLYEQGMVYLRLATRTLEPGFPDLQGIQDWNQLFMKNATKLLDLQNKTIEALTRYKQRGEQRITVVHQSVNVEGGGQAVVGNFQTGEGGNNKN